MSISSSGQECRTGSVVTWGRANFESDAIRVQEQFTIGVLQAVGTGFAFARIKADGSLVTGATFFWWILFPVQEQWTPRVRGAEES